MKHDDLFVVLEIVMDDIAAELTLEQRLRLAKLIRYRSVIEEDDEVVVLALMAERLEQFGFSMDTTDPANL